MKFSHLFSLIVLFLAVMPGISHAEKEADAPAKLEEAVRKLQELGVITDSSYWIEQARKGKSCDGAMVGDLLVSAARKFGQVDNLEAAIKVLKDNDIIQNRQVEEYWQNKAVAGSNCPGSFVATMIIRLSDKL